jgi:hypothetical protein
MSNELDLQDQARIDDNFNKLNSIIDQISDLDVFPSLVWVWCWDLVLDKYKNHQEGVDDQYVISPEWDLKKIFTLFWEEADQNGFTLQYGTEDLDEAIWDWMIDNDILIMIESDEEE